jgi:cell division protein FtsL
MIRVTTLLWVVLLVIAGGTVMRVSYQVRHVEQHLSELNRDTRVEQDRLRVLNAEWDTLNDPQRIDTLAKRYLTLEATPIARVVAFDAVPMKLSDDQIAKLAAASPAKVAKASSGAPKTTANKPETLIRAPAPQTIARSPVPAVSGTGRVPQAPHQDDVGMILARMEKHE